MRIFTRVRKNHIAAHSGEQIRTLMSGLMPDTGPKTAELAVLYHNTDLLLREYAKGRSAAKALGLPIHPGG